MRRLAAVLLVLSTILATAPATAADAPAAAGAAFMAGDGDVFVLGADGARRQIYSTGEEGGVVRQSPNLRYVAIRLGEFTGGVVMVDTATDATHEWVCGCGEIAMTNSEVVAFDAERRMFRFPVGGGESVVRRTDLPRSKVGQDFPATVLTATGKKAVVVIGDPAGTSAYGGPEQMYVVRRDGSTRHLRQTDANRYVSTSARHPDRPVVAYDEQWHADACRTAGAVTLTNFRTGRSRLLGRYGKGTWRVLDVGFDADGGLHATMMRTRFADDGSCETVSGPALFRREAGEWERIRNAVSRFAFGADGTLVSIRPAREGADAGRLIVEDAAGERTRIARGAQDVVWGR